MTEKQTNVDMTAETISADLINMLVGELKLLPDIWPKIGPDEQDDIIERVRKRVLDNTRRAVELIASAGRITVAGDLKKVTFSDKVQAVFDLSKNDPAALELCHAQGQLCLIVVANASAHMAGAGDEAAERQLGLHLDVDGHGEANQILDQVRRRMQGGTPPTDDQNGAEPPSDL